MQKCNVYAFGCKNILRIDPLIKPLIFALNNRNIKTTKSCQGHFGEITSTKTNYPWVVIDDDYVEELKSLVKEYNTTVEEPWVVTLDNFKVWFLRPVNRSRNTEFLQEQILKIAKYLDG